MIREHFKTNGFPNVRKVTTKGKRYKYMTKTEKRQFAKDKLMESIAVAYYKLEDENFSDDEAEEISGYINQYGEAMAKSIGKRYYTM